MKNDVIVQLPLQFYIGHRSWVGASPNRGETLLLRAVVEAKRLQRNEMDRRTTTEGRSKTQIDGHVIIRIHYTTGQSSRTVRVHFGVSEKCSFVSLFFRATV